MRLPGRRTRIGVTAVLALLLVGVAAGVWRFRESPAERVERLLTEAQAFRLKGDDAQAEQAAATALRLDDGSAKAALLAAEVALEQAEYRRAADYLARVTHGDRSLRLRAALLAAEVHHHRLLRLSEAEWYYRLALELDPDHREANVGLAKLLGLCGRRDEAIPHVLRLVRQGEITDLLILIARESGAISDPEKLEAARRAAPDDANPLIGLAWEAASAEDTNRAIDLLQRAVKLEPDSVAAQAALGEQLFDAGRYDAIPNWAQHLPPAAGDSDEVWIVRGQMAENGEHLQAAVRCYGEAVQRAPESKFATYRLAHLLAKDGRTDLSRQFAERLRHIQHLEQVQDGILFSSGHEDVTPLLELIDAYEAAGRYWEAYGWSLLAVDVAPTRSDATQRLKRMHAKVEGLPLRLTAEAANPVRSLDLLSYPLPSFDRGASSPSIEAGTDSATEILFRDDAESTGLRFRYFNGTDGSPTHRMFEFTGGGIGVLDFDRDGFSDVCFTQGRPWSLESSSADHRDRIFRNVDGHRFEDATIAAGIDEDGFGQGVTVGDFDADGFQDLYVANIGRNRLWRNNGDGTFTDASDRAGIAGTEWTTSCLMADLDGDTLPDLYDVNYVTADDVFDRVCKNPDGSPTICMPFDFDEQPDRVWRNLGDGRFIDATSELLSTPVGGKGLGIAAWNADGTGRLSVFVANDTTPSFFFMPESSGARVRLTEHGIASGLALNGDGKATGCMGVALGDVDGDRRLDVFITNFLAEPNTLFLNPAPGLYQDRTRDFGLHAPSFETLGFGTQFLDADLDGQLELFVANGHIADLSRFDKPYEMQAQLFRRHGSRFEEVEAARLGSYFEKKWLGRSVARFDWNRDGRQDLAVGHLAAASALLTNTTPDVGHRLSLELTGVASNRDAIGTTVEARVGDRTIVRQLTAGDGYQASNERRVTFGAGDAEHIDELVVKWPSGAVQTFSDVPTSRAISLTEGRRLLPLP
ncbi:MAG: FG-GAP-like repeat-containing protein [Planctomycetaceae bacterium]